MAAAEPEKKDVVAADDAEAPAAKKAKVETTSNGTSSGAAAEIDQAAVGKLLAFYFGDSNFRHDKFLQAETAKDPKGGFVKISVLLTFNKLKALTEDAAAVARCIEESAATKDFLVLNEARDGVKRAKPLSSADDSAPRTLFVDGLDTENEPAVDALVDLFKAWGDVAYVRKRRGVANPGAVSRNRGRDVPPPPKKFLGSAFIEYVSISGVVAACAVADTEGIRFGEKSLTCMPLEQWLEKSRNSRKSVDDRRGDRRDDRDRKRKADDEGEDSSPKKVRYDPGKIVKLAGIPEGTTREQIKETLGTHGLVRYVDFGAGDTEGFARFDTPDGAKTAVEACVGGLAFGESEKANGKAETEDKAEVTKGSTEGEGKAEAGGETETETAGEGEGEGEDKSKDTSEGEGEGEGESTDAKPAADAGASKASVTLLEGEEEEAYWGRVAAAQAEHRRDHSRKGNRGHRDGRRDRDNRGGHRNKRSRDH